MMPQSVDEAIDAIYSAQGRVIVQLDEIEAETGARPAVSDVSAVLCEDSRSIMFFCEIGRDLPLTSTITLGNRTAEAEFDPEPFVLSFFVMLGLNEALKRAAP